MVAIFLNENLSTLKNISLKMLTYTKENALKIILNDYFFRFIFSNCEDGHYWS